MYPDSLECPCNTISISYSIFINIEPHYHQVCSSDFIGDAWLTNYLTFGKSTNIIFLEDILRQGRSQFEILAQFCSSSQQTTSASVKTFLNRAIVNLEVIQPELFQFQMNSFIKVFQSTTLNQFLMIFRLVQAITQGNHLTDGIRSIVFEMDPSLEKVTMLFRQFSNCSCDLSNACSYPLGFFFPFIDTYTSSRFFTFPNFVGGCTSMDGLLASTLECFYSQSCLLDMNNHRNRLFATPVNDFPFSPLNSTLNSPYEKIESIFNRLMIDSWSSNVSFSSYYKACAPLSCTYEYISRKSFLTIITTVIGIFGGLSLAYKLIILIILRVIEKLMLYGLFDINLMRFIKDIFSFRTQEQRINRLHIILVIAALCIISIFSTLKSQLITVKVDKPSLSTYNDLARRYQYSLQCPCSQISITYGSFMTIVPSFHQICSSSFVSQRWIDYLYDGGNLADRFAHTDFKYSAFAQFQLLSSFCDLSYGIVNDTLLQLITSNLINLDLLSSDLFDQQIEVIINDLKETMSNSFINILSMIREITFGNKLISALSTNAIFNISTFPAFDYQNALNLIAVSVRYGECVCRMSQTCVQSSQGMFAGCYPLDSLFQSRLKCFYDQQCIDSTNTFKPLNSSQLTHFDVNATIETIVNQLMIETFSVNKSYENYFNQCLPLSCTYTYTDTTNVAEGIANFVQFYGSFVIIGRVFAVIIIKLFPRRNRRIIPAID
ncbi:unnamed protein product [Adineta steineri]|uniref:Uncharacterized protein n=1 Tax=Adineta steineri TaxID=433720 RepID=A0A814MYI4_9BILA|nr:unnamed protein product [Adineta steineri]CAF1384472.1 unnamed protein product [Adineta steineri]CAF1430737.1 unnamed protein product [Adineta steineri]CAF3539441.1 unnamed protein product [Adineta steineri]CAF3787576.1 unnamed protein product [Adineta steineri]